MPRGVDQACLTGLGPGEASSPDHMLRLHPLACTCTQRQRPRASHRPSLRAAVRGSVRWCALGLPSPAPCCTVLHARACLPYQPCSSSPTPCRVRIHLSSRHFTLHIPSLPTSLSSTHLLFLLVGFFLGVRTRPSPQEPCLSPASASSYAYTSIFSSISSLQPPPHQQIPINRREAPPLRESALTPAVRGILVAV